MKLILLGSGVIMVIVLGGLFYLSSSDVTVVQKQTSKEIPNERFFSQ